MPLKHGERREQRVRLGSGDTLREPGECRGPVTRLVKRGKHQLCDICLAGLGRTVPPGAAIPFPAREALLRQPIKHRHDGGMREVLRESVADFSDR
jgi:hypothetical protein